jgi:serine/threonine protein kinase
MPTLDTVTIKKEIGKGMLGTVYLALDNKNNKYAIKKEQILKKEINKSYKSYKSLIWREIEFAETMNKLYPKQFMTLYDYKIDTDCKHTQNFDGFDFELKDLPKAQQTFYKMLWKSKICSIKLYSYVNTTLHGVLNSWKKFDNKIFYDLFIQIIYVVYLMNKHGYFHNDFHPKNIGIVHTKDKYIDILGHKILTHGMNVQAIDYGLVLHKKYKLKGWEKIKLENDNDLFTILNLLVFDHSNFEYEYKNNLKNIKEC